MPNPPHRNTIRKRNIPKSTRQRHYRQIITTPTATPKSPGPKIHQSKRKGNTRIEKTKTNLYYLYLKMDERIITLERELSANSGDVALRDRLIRAYRQTLPSMEECRALLSEDFENELLGKTMIEVYPGLNYLGVTWGTVNEEQVTWRGHMSRIQEDGFTRGPTPQEASSLLIANSEGKLSGSLEEAAKSYDNRPTYTCHAAELTEKDEIIFTFNIFEFVSGLEYNPNFRDYTTGGQWHKNKKQFDVTNFFKGSKNPELEKYLFTRELPIPHLKNAKINLQSYRINGLYCLCMSISGAEVITHARSIGVKEKWMNE